MRRYLSLALAILLIASIPASATVFATVRGEVHDPQHRPIVGATVTLQAVDSSFALSTKTDSAGEFGLPQAPIGIYRLTHAFGENWNVSGSILNVTNHRVLLDNSITIGGFHYNDPRMFSAELRYRFHF
jgi:hypothetical protein